MSIAFEVVSRHSAYAVTVQRGAVAGLLAQHPDAHVIIDAALTAQVKLLPSQACLAIAATEDNKEYAAIGPYIQRLRELRLNRKSTLIAIGGGVIQDIAGFIASIYMRGVAWHYAPTTLLGMVDSCIGGKSSINLEGTKNLVGTFYPPQSVVADPAFIATLQPLQIVDGRCEAAKICFAHPDPEVFAAYLALDAPSPSSFGLTEGSRTIVGDPSVKPKDDEYQRIIALTLQSKKWFIETDEFDRNERLLLNFGHTFGHAIETAAQYAISHGVAVGLGMLCAMAFRPDAMAHPRVAQLHGHIYGLLRSVPELTPVVRGLEVEKILAAFQSDKKHTSAEYTVIVPDKNGGAVRENVARNSQSDKALAQAIGKVMTEYGEI